MKVGTSLYRMRSRTGELPPNRRLAYIELSADSLIELFKRMDGKELLVLKGLPDDAKVVGTTVRHDLLNNICVLLESEFFPEVDEGMITLPTQLWVESLGMQDEVNDA